MTFKLAWLDFYLQERLFGFGLLGFSFKEKIRNFFCIYYFEREWVFELFWIRFINYAGV